MRKPLLTPLAKLVMLNPESIGKDYPFEEIEYIDISSVGSGVLVSEPILIPLKTAPSRAKRIVRDGDTIIANVRPNLRSFFFIKNPKPNTVVSTGFTVLRSLERVDPRFIFYAITDQNFTEYLSNNAKGTSYPAVDTDTIARGLIPDMHLEIQHKVGNSLSAYDDLIENNQRRITLLEESARLLYQEWFVRLRFPGYEHVRLVDGVPEGWKWCTLADLADVTMGQSPESKYYNDHGEGLPFHQGVADFGDRFVFNRIYCTMENRIAQAGDILCSVRAPVGRLNITMDKIIIGRGLAALRSKSHHQSLLFYQLRAHFFKEDLIGTGAIFASVTKKEFEAQTLLNPPERIATSFEEIAKPIDEQIKLLTLQNQKLRAARDILLPKLMNGEIAV